jgi:hypothetical protein
MIALNMSKGTTIAERSLEKSGAKYFVVRLLLNDKK